MCGRFTLRTPTKVIVEAFGLAEAPDLKLRLNIAPTQQVPAIRLDPSTGTRQLSMFRWGLVPSWADDPSIGYRMINARAESVAMKPAFRNAFNKGRCLIVADGFYEWKPNELMEGIHDRMLVVLSPVTISGSNPTFTDRANCWRC